MRTRLLLIFWTLPFLLSCSARPVKDVSPASDLELVRIGVEILLRPREPAGPIKLVEQARTGRELHAVATDLEEVDWLHEMDKTDALEFINRSTRRIEATRVQCPWWNWSCHKRRNALEDGRAPE